MVVLNMCLFSHLGKIQILTNIFSKGLKPPTRWSLFVSDLMLRWVIGAEHSCRLNSLVLPDCFTTKGRFEFDALPPCIILHISIEQGTMFCHELHESNYCMLFCLHLRQTWLLTAAKWTHLLQTWQVWTSQLSFAAFFVLSNGELPSWPSLQWH